MTKQLIHDTKSNEFKRNQISYQTYTNELTKLKAIIHSGGHPSAKEKHISKGKLLPRERIKNILDPNSEFLELSEFAGYKLYPDIPLPAGGIITGIGFIEQKPCMIIANDPTVKGGTYFPITIKKHLRAQEIAMQHHLPCVYLVDSGGAYLPLQDEVFPDRLHFGRIFYNQARMSAAGISQFALVLGSCTAGGAYIPAMADESIMVKNQATIFLAGPPLVEAATGELISAEELGGSSVHCRISGVADMEVNNEALAFKKIRNRFKYLKSKAHPELTTYEAPLLEKEFISGFIPDDPRHLPDIFGILSCILDGSTLDPFKPQYGTTIICGFAAISGHTVGLLANNGILNSEASLKATHFIQLCCKQETPLIFLQNINGFLVGKQPERKGIAKHGAKMVMAVANANVPKYTIIIGGSYGAGNYAMCGRAYDPNFLWLWPNAKVAVMGGTQAAHVLAAIKSKDDQKNLICDFNQQSQALYGSARLWDDGIIHPTETREVLTKALNLSHKIARKPYEAGVFRM